MNKQKNRSFKSGTLLLFCFLGLTLIYSGFDGIQTGRSRSIKSGRFFFYSNDPPTELAVGILILFFCFVTWRYYYKKSNKVPDRHKKILAQRRKDLEEGKAKFYDWDDIKDEIKKVD